ncbi:MAG: hypothetical protein IB618_03655 [Candidatus Pacearchaeota archaeon]|nr:MAG: hypothetical protein IB618_03655 [Candidatus Pacearchaeota archaeon]
MEGKNTLNNLKEKKKVILGIIENKGPSLPSAISRKIGVSLLLTSALLSDMRADKSLRLSRLKIGGSPLYYIQGQEGQLENFIKHLQPKERGAFELLKKKQVIDEEKVEPAYRVAFSNMKDFAFPLYVKINNSEKIFWRFHSISQEDASKRISELLKEKHKPKPPKIEKEKEKIEKKPTEEKKEEKTEIQKIKKRIRGSKEEFRKKVFSWLDAKDLHIIEELDAEDAFCTVSTKSEIGYLNFLVVAKKKKIINEADLSLAYQKGQQAKMLVLFLTTGKLTKKAQSYIGNLGKFIIVNSL